MNSGFRGTTVALRDIRITQKGPRTSVSCTALFMDGEGTVHGTMPHDAEVGEEGELRDAVKALHDALISHIESVHYESTSSSGSSPKAVRRGIAEALHGSGSSDDSDGPGEAG